MTKYQDTTYNYNSPASLHGELGRVFQLAMRQSVVEQIFATIPVPLPASVEEVQAELLFSKFNTKISKKLSFDAPNSLASVSMKQPANWVHTPIEVDKVLFEAGLINTLPSNVANQKASDHAYMRDKYIFRSDTREPQWIGAITKSSGGTVNNPSDCNSTAGTHETGSSWTGSQATAFAFTSDLKTMIKDIESKDDGNGKTIVQRTPAGQVLGNYVLLIHPNARPHLLHEVYNGSFYLDVNYENYIKNVLGINVVYTPFADDDFTYTGAEDATTDVVLVYNPGENFFTGVIQGFQEEAPWGAWLNDDRTMVRNRYQEKLVGMIAAYLVSGTYYKAQASATITPWNNAA